MHDDDARERLNQIYTDEERLLDQLYPDKDSIIEELIRADGEYVPGSAGSRSTTYRASEIAVQRLYAKDPDLYCKLYSEIVALYREEERLSALLHPGQVDEIAIQNPLQLH